MNKEKITRLADVSGSTFIDLKGSAEHLRCSASGESMIRAYKCKSTNIDAAVKGSAEVYVYAEQSLNAHVAGRGSLYYRGKPEKFNKTVRNSGRIYNK
ncbi:MAG: GIN domain-containing protein [Treponema sp.]